MSEKVPVAELSRPVAWVVNELNLVDDKGDVQREHVRTLGEFLLRFAPGDPSRAAVALATTTDRAATPRHPRARRGPTKAEVRAELTARIANHLSQRPGSTITEVAETLSVSVEEALVAARPVDWLILDAGDLGEPAARGESQAAAATRERAKAALQAASLMAGPLSHQAYTTLVREGRVKGPSVARIVQLFGSWTAACAEVGVTSGEPLRKNYERRWTPDEVLGHVQRFLREPSYKGASHQYDTWRAAVNGDGSVPSLGTVRNLVGGTWRDIRTRALRAMRAEWDH